jgi:hypothetical protein
MQAMPRTKTLLVVLLLFMPLAGCAPRAPTWPPFGDTLTQDARWYLDGDQFRRSAHGGLTCEECHPDIVTTDPAEPHPDPMQVTGDAFALYDYRACEACHPQEYAAWQVGAHAEALARPEEITLEADAPTCGHCHDSHYATPETRASLLASVSQTCGECHPDALASYEHNYHGKAAILGHQQSATCSDCHGAHTVLALYEADEAIPACRRCHPDANTRLIGFRIHAEETLTPAEDDPRAQDFKLFFWVKLFFTVLVVSVLAFFYTHTGLWFLRSLHERLRGGQHG